MGSLDRTSKQPDVPDEGKPDDPYDPGHLTEIGGDDLEELDDQRRSKYEQVLEVVRKHENIESIESVGEESFRVGEAYRLPDRVKPSGTHAGTPDRPEVYRASHEELHGGEITIVPVVAWLLGHYGVEKVREWLAGKRRAGETDGGD